MVEPLYRPEPKSGCTCTPEPIKVMIASELGSERCVGDVRVSIGCWSGRARTRSGLPPDRDQSG